MSDSYDLTFLVIVLRDLSPLQTFWVSGSCPYGKRCCFIHTELPANGSPPGADGNPPPPPPARARSNTASSDPNEAPVSLLARISAKRKEEASTPTTATPGGANGPEGQAFTFTKPGALRVDTTVLDNASMKQNKSAYPTFASNAVSAISPGPVTAGPDFGRHMRSGLMDIGQVSRDRLCDELALRAAPTSWGERRRTARRGRASVQVREP